jgi:hypothetical protein
LAVHQSNYQPAKNLLSNFPELKSKMDSGKLTWQYISDKWFAEKD